MDGTELPERATVSFSVDGPRVAALSGDVSAKALGDVTAVIVTIADASGVVVHDRETLTLRRFGASYVTDALALATGSYTLTEFMVTDATAAVIYATPLEGSPLAPLVADPLPIAFTVSSNAVTTIRPELLSTAALTPDDFGYASFVLDDGSVVDVMHVQLAVFGADPVTGVPVPIGASVMVANELGEVRYRADVAPAVTVVPLPSGDGEYRIIVSRDLYRVVTRVFTEADLRGHLIGQGAPLAIHLERCAGLETDENITVDSQAEVDALRDHIRINELTITGHDILNLDGLACLRRIDESLDINDT